MPIFTFLCKVCDRKFDILTGVGQGETKKECPFCGSRNIKKIFAPFKISGGTFSKCSSCSGGDCSSCS